VKLVLLLFVLPAILLGVLAWFLAYWFGASEHAQLFVGTQTPVAVLLLIWAAAIWSAPERSS
jgi:hypothetical protein